jgi:hypothetical protein
MKTPDIEIEFEHLSDSQLLRYRDSLANYVQPFLGILHMVDAELNDRGKGPRQVMAAFNRRNVG